MPQADEKGNYMPSPKVSKKECMIDGKRIEYDAACVNSKEDAIKFYELHGFQYIGSGTKEWIDGVLQNNSRLTHFFIKEKK